MKTLLTLTALCLTMMVNAQWIENTSCDKNAALVANQAIEYANEFRVYGCIWCC